MRVQDHVKLKNRRKKGAGSPASRTSISSMAAAGQFHVCYCDNISFCQSAKGDKYFRLEVFKTVRQVFSGGRNGAFYFPIAIKSSGYW